MATLSRTAPFIGAVQDEWQLFSDRAEDYALGPTIGFGSSSIVYQATYHPKDSQGTPLPCALKVLDLDRLPQGSLRLLQRETQLMSLSKHPNVLRVRGSWLDDHKLHIALRLMNAGSAADVMHYAWPGGMEEEVVRCILKQALEGLNYLHINGFIHRDIKAANLLIDDDGTVLLGDLGVAAPLNDEDHTHFNDHAVAFRAVIFDPDVKPVPRHSRVGKRRSFVGTPCWMAPELISGIQYDWSADIWSFGITALELAQGRAPRSRESSRTLLSHMYLTPWLSIHQIWADPSLFTELDLIVILAGSVEAAPPTLDREGGVHKYSRAFKEIVERCLVKDPSLRPPAAQLLQTPFFKNAKKGSYLVGAILRDLPPLAQRLERRQQPSSQQHNTIDSWDFPTTLIVPSPTQSVFPTSLDRPERIYEQDEKDNAPGERTTEQIQIAAHGAKSPTTIHTSSPSLSKPTSVAGNSESLSANTSTSAPSPTVSAPVSLNQVVSPPNQSLWRRIRRSTGYSSHSKEAAQARSTFINNMLHRGEGSREVIP